MTDVEVLRPLVDDLIDRASESHQAERAERFAALNNLEAIDRAPVATVHELIPDEHWNLMLGDDVPLCSAADARALEWRLRRDLWADANISDDRPLFGHVVVHAAIEWERGWGVELGRDSVGGATTAWGYSPAFETGIDLNRLTQPVRRHDEAETARRVERASELLEGRVPVVVQVPHLGHHLFDVATQMRGMDGLLLDCAAEPTAVHGVMDFLAEAIRADHLWRESEGLLCGVPSPCGGYYTLDWPFFHCARWPGTLDSLVQEWAYISSQTSAGLGPKQFAELVYPYLQRLASLHPDGTVYFHGCECLDDKFGILSELNGLRRIHVSPWSSVKRAREVFGRDVVLEVHSHPTEVFFTRDRDGLRDEISRLFDDAGDARLDLNLNDIHSINGNPDRLREWTEIAVETSAKAGPR